MELLHRWKGNRVVHVFEDWAPQKDFIYVLQSKTKLLILLLLWFDNPDFLSSQLVASKSMDYQDIAIPVLTRYLVPYR